jgi:hypothetical protein
MGVKRKLFKEQKMHLVKPRQSWLEKFRSEVKSFSPNVKAAIISLIGVLLLALLGFVGGCVKERSENTRLKAENTKIKSELAEVKRERDTYFNALQPWQALASAIYTNAPPDARIGLLLSEVTQMRDTLLGLQTQFNQKPGIRLLIQGFDPHRAYVHLPMPEVGDVTQLPLTITNASMTSASDVYVVVRMDILNASGPGWFNNSHGGKGEYLFRAGNIHGGDKHGIPALNFTVPPGAIWRTNGAVTGVNAEVLVKSAETAIAPRFRMFFHRGHRSVVMQRISNVDEILSQLREDEVVEFVIPTDFLKMGTNPAPEL